MNKDEIENILFEKRNENKAEELRRLEISGKFFDRSEMIDAMDEAEDRRREERVFQEAERRQAFRNKGGVETKELLEIQEQIDELMKVLGFKTDGNGNDLGGIDHTTEFGKRRIERIWDENVLEWDRINKLMVQEDRMMEI